VKAIVQQTPTDQIRDAWRTNGP